MTVFKFVVVMKKGTIIILLLYEYELIKKKKHFNFVLEQCKKWTVNKKKDCFLWFGPKRLSLFFLNHFT